MKKIETIEVQLSLSYPETMMEFEKRYLEIAINLFDGNITHTAKAIGIPKSTLNQKVHKYQMNKKQLFSQ